MCTVGVIAGVIVGVFIGLVFGSIATTKHDKDQAAKAGVGFWECDSKTGKTTFYFGVEEKEPEKEEKEE